MNRQLNILDVSPEMLFLPNFFAFDRTKTTDRNAVHILAAAASAFGHNPTSMTISRQTIRRRRQDA